MRNKPQRTNDYWHRINKYSTCKYINRHLSVDFNESFIRHHNHKIQKLRFPLLLLLFYFNSIRLTDGVLRMFYFVAVFHDCNKYIYVLQIVMLLKRFQLFAQFCLLPRVKENEPKRVMYMKNTHKMKKRRKLCGMKAGDNTVNMNEWYFKCEMHVSWEIFHLPLVGSVCFFHFFLIFRVCFWNCAISLFTLDSIVVS